MEPESLLAQMQVPATCPYAEPGQSSPCLPSHFLKIHLNNVIAPLPGYTSIRYDL